MDLGDQDLFGDVPQPFDSAEFNLVDPVAMTSPSSTNGGTHLESLAFPGPPDTLVDLQEELNEYHRKSSRLLQHIRASGALISPSYAQRLARFAENHVANLRLTLELPLTTTLGKHERDTLVPQASPPKRHKAAPVLPPQPQAEEEEPVYRVQLGSDDDEDDDDEDEAKVQYTDVSDGDQFEPFVIPMPKIEAMAAQFNGCSVGRFGFPPAEFKLVLRQRNKQPWNNLTSQYQFTDQEVVYLDKLYTFLSSADLEVMWWNAFGDCFPPETRDQALEGHQLLRLDEIKDKRLAESVRVHIYRKMGQGSVKEVKTTAYVDPQSMQRFQVLSHGPVPITTRVWRGLDVIQQACLLFLGRSVTYLTDHEKLATKRSVQWSMNLYNMPVIWDRKFPLVPSPLVSSLVQTVHLLCCTSFTCDYSSLLNEHRAHEVCWNGFFHRFAAHVSEEDTKINPERSVGYMTIPEGVYRAVSQPEKSLRYTPIIFRGFLEWVLRHSKKGSHPCNPNGIRFAKLARKPL